ncbi:Ti-type conjugative transfer system protein TraG [Microvirga puerhi]|uniref:Ti-type conjugative transfer system protein TraG n=1 Tax=Microvirga puerhi TaxID=2876078 RepID=A0ABS7VUQ4_9HYPH|nr:Ti-type conjugative transfer system protein TraG [Microvirga puerhi]MBZ6078850.1 Ti-type conjugative transfer system protein TraG [Microvirga puerhi]
MTKLSHDWRKVGLATFPVLIAVTVWGLSAVSWPKLALAMQGQIQYWFLRSLPAVNLAMPAAITLGIVALLPRHWRLLPPRTAMVMLFLATAYYGYGEYSRLAPYAVQYGWDVLMKFIDPVAGGGFVAGFMAVGFSARLSMGRGDPIKRSSRATLGDAKWMSLSEAGKLFPESGGIVIGERYRPDLDPTAETDFVPGDPSTWGQGGKAPLLTFNADFGSTHGLIFAGSGGFKTTGSVIPSALKWTGPLVCLDPSTEIAPLVKEHRTRKLGRQVYVLDPGGRHGFNVLDWISQSANPEMDIASVARWLLTEKPKTHGSSDGFFEQAAFNLLTGLLAHVVLSREYEGERSLRGLRELVAAPEEQLKEMLQNIYETTDSVFVKQQVGVFIKMTENTFSGVYSTASNDTAWLSFPEYASLVCGNSFRTSNLASGEIDVFLNLSVRTLSTYPAIGRVIIGALINAMMQADGHHESRVLFLLDEVNLLGTMSILEVARDVGRKYGITLLLVYQSIGQLAKNFGDAGKAAWFESASFLAFAAVNDLKVAEEISKRCGDLTVEVNNTTKSAAAFGNKGGGRASQSTNLQRRPLLMPHEVMHDLRTDEQIVFVTNRPPLRCGRAIYFRRDDMRSLVGQSRFAQR